MHISSDRTRRWHSCCFTHAEWLWSPISVRWSWCSVAWLNSSLQLELLFSAAVDLCRPTSSYIIDSVISDSAAFRHKSITWALNWSRRNRRQSIYWRLPRLARGNVWRTDNRSDRSTYSIEKTDWVSVYQPFSAPEFPENRLFIVMCHHRPRVLGYIGEIKSVTIRVRFNIGWTTLLRRSTFIQWKRWHSAAILDCKSSFHESDTKNVTEEKREQSTNWSE